MSTPRQQITFRLPPDLITEGRAVAERTGFTLTDLVELGLRREVGMEPQEGTQNPMVDIGGIEDRLHRLERLAEQSGAV